MLWQSSAGAQCTWYRAFRSKDFLFQLFINFKFLLLCHQNKKLELNEYYFKNTPFGAFFHKTYRLGLDTYYKEQNTKLLQNIDGRLL